MTITQVAKGLGTTRMQIWRWVVSGKVMAKKKKTKRTPGWMWTIDPKSKVPIKYVKGRIRYTVYVPLEEIL